MTSNYGRAVRSFLRLGLRQPSICIRCTRRSYTVGRSRTYDDAVALLNTFQTPYDVLKKRMEAGIKPDENANKDMRKYLSMIGYSSSDLDSLNVVHVAGTKGKGTTCAYVNSILAQYRKNYGFPKKVGLYTSPHLISVRERIRINTTPISPELFAKYFFEVHDLLEAKLAVAAENGSSEDMPIEPRPVYFRFLTLMSYHVFLQEGINIAIYETGIGGEFDSTNIVEHPACTGITALGIDHTFALGTELTQIARHKAGIQKSGAPSFTVHQPEDAMKVLQNVAKERGVILHNVTDRLGRVEEVNIQPSFEFQRENANLAVSLAQTVLQKSMNNEFSLANKPVEKLDLSSRKTTLPKEFVDGLEQMVWRGRFETKKEKAITWYLDGAHTEDSMNFAAAWYTQRARRFKTRVLIFNQQGLRDPFKLLDILHKHVTGHTAQLSPNQQSLSGSARPHHVIFCPSASVGNKSSKNDFVNLSNDSEEIANLSFQRRLAEKWASLEENQATGKNLTALPVPRVDVLPSIDDAIDFVRDIANTKEDKGEEQIGVFVTGSIHLVGRALDILETSQQSVN
ncbi:FolC protein [Bisporella sp. PMI_857]|nr:FolC protein [Bisporella sp. PMI_857]